MNNTDTMPTPREVWGTCCTSDPKCEHSFLNSDELAKYMDTPILHGNTSSAIRTQDGGVPDSHLHIVERQALKAGLGRALRMGCDDGHDAFGRLCLSLRVDVADYLECYA